MTFDLEEAIRILEGTPEVLAALTGRLPERWLRADEGEDTWIPLDILGHLIHGEKTDWMVRARIIVEDRASKAFRPFDRFAHLKGSGADDVSTLLRTFAKLRQENLESLKQMGLTDEDLGKAGIHPDLGEVTLRQLLSTWVVHDLSHVRQIARVMARQYRDEVGPWERYLRVVHE